MASSNLAPNTAGTYIETGRLYSGSEVSLIAGLFRAKDEADSHRRAAISRRIDVYEDDWMTLLKDRIAASFNRENAAELFKVADVTNNPLKRITNQISTIYKSPPSWAFEEGIDGEQWQEVLLGAKAQIVMPELNRRVNLCNQSALYISPGEDSLRFEVTTPDKIKVWQDPKDPTQAWTVAVLSSMSDTSGALDCWHVWSKGDGETGYYQKRDGLDQNSRILEEFDNPYRDEFGRPVLPVVIYHRRPPSGRIWDQTSGEDLYEATLLIGMLETWINHLIRTDSIRQKWATGQLAADGDLGTQIGGTTNLLMFRSPTGDPVTIGEFASQADWTGLSSVISRKLGNVLHNNGISQADFEVTGDAQSGFALRVRKEGLVEIREEQIPVYQCYDKELYRVVSAVWNFEITNAEHPGIRGDSLPWPSVAKPQITYAPFQTTLTVQERREELELNKLRMEMGLETPITIYMREHPEVSVEEAMEKIVENKRLTKQLGGNAAANIAGSTAPPPGSQMPGLADVLAQRLNARAAEAQQTPPNQETEEETEE